MTPPSPPPANRCVLDLWEQDIEHDPIIADVAARMLLNDPQRVNQLTELPVLESILRAELRDALSERQVDRIIENLRPLARLLPLTGHESDAKAICDDVLKMLRSGGALHSKDIDRLANELAQLHRTTGQAKETFLIEFALRVQPLLRNADAPRTHFTDLRQFAFRAYEVGCLAEADLIYRFLLSANEERAGVRSHLARVLVACGRYSEALREIESGLEIARSESTDAYIIARLYYLRALSQTLLGADAHEALDALGNCGRDALAEWLFLPMLTAARPRLSAESFEMFRELALSMGGIREQVSKAARTRLAKKSRKALAIVSRKR